MGKKTVTILVPAYNEEEVLPQFYGRLTEVLATLPAYAFEILFVDDGSSDGTVQAILNLATGDGRISLVQLSRNFGKEAGMLAGLDAVTTDAVIVIDADLQDPPELIPTLIEKWEEGYEDVYVKRRSRDGESFLKRFTSKMYYRVLQSVTRIPIQEDTGDYRLLDRKCIDALVRFREQGRNTKGLFSWIGFKKAEVLMDRQPRAAGSTKWSYRALVNLAIDGITSFTVAPLRLATYVGIGVSMAAFCYVLFIVIRTLIYGSDVAGYPSLMAVILFLGGVQLLTVGIVGEYVGRVFIEAKQRPIYLVREEHRGRPE